MNRTIVYPSAIPQDTDLLLTNKHTMIGLGYLMQAVLGTSTFVDGLACTPTGPAGLTVNVGGGSIYSLAQIDATAYGSIAADTTDQIVKQGIMIATKNLSCPAPVTSGQSVVYLIEAAYQEVDGGSTVLPYYNASNPTVPYSGPNNSGTPNYTIRQGLCTVQVKTGVAATTGTQAAPSPDAGFTGLYAVTVANGQTTITSGSIAPLVSAPFIGPKLPAMIAAVQAGSANFSHDTNPSANTIAVTLSPVPAQLTDGMRIFVKVNNTCTGATVMNTNGLGSVPVVTKEGNAMTTGALVANGIYHLVYDANGTRWQVQNPSGTNLSFTGSAPSTGAANAQVVAATAPLGFADTTGNSLYFQAGFTNTGSCTMNIVGTGPQVIYKNVYGTLTALTGGELQSGGAYIIYVTQGGTYVLINPTISAPNFFSTNPSNPTGTTSTSFVMMGLAGAITPSSTGVIKFELAGNISNTATNGSIVQLFYGTGTAPTNGAAATGNSVSGPVQITPDVAGNLVPFTCSGIVSGLAPGVPLWIDAQLKTQVSGTANLYNLSFTAFEIR